jgi:hypothetical protein
MIDHISYGSNNFTNYINLKIKDFFSSKKYGVIFGQNIISGSRISGLGHGLDELKNVNALNTTNSENSLMGLGLGLAMEGTPSLFLMKQHDFAILGLDQLTNTVNLISKLGFKESFILIMVIVDSGYEGPQASLNNIDEFASLTRSPIYYLNCKENIEKAFESAHSPGLHMMVLSQKNMKAPVASFKMERMRIQIGVSNFNNILIYSGLDLNFINQLISIGISQNKQFDLFVNNQIPFLDENHLVTDFRNYKNIVFVQDTKSLFSASQRLASKLSEFENRIHVFNRVPNEKWSTVFEDIPEYRAVDVINRLT